MYTTSFVKEHLPHSADLFMTRISCNARATTREGRFFSGRIFSGLRSSSGRGSDTAPARSPAPSPSEAPIFGRRSAAGWPNNPFVFSRLTFHLAPHKLEFPGFALPPSLTQSPSLSVSIPISLSLSLSRSSSRGTRQ